MLNSVSLESVNEIINQRISEFINVVQKSLDMDDYARRGPKRERISFSVLHPAEDEFRENLAYSTKLEVMIRRDLVNPIMEELFYLHGVKNFGYAEKVKWNQNKPLVSPSTIRFHEEVNGFQFIFQGNHFRPCVVKYDIDSLYTNEQFMKKSWILHKIYVIDWDEKGHREDHNVSLPDHHYRHKRFFQKVEMLSLLDFFELFFSLEEYNIFVSRIQEAIREANELIGFDTIRVFSPRYMHRFKKRIQMDLESKKLRNAVYHSMTKHGGIVDYDMRDLLLKNEDGKCDIDQISESFFQNQKYLTLIGQSGFATSFVTAEYLYSLFDKDFNSIDYTAVACGYLKCVEQLIYRIVIILLDSGLYSNSKISLGNLGALNDKEMEESIKKLWNENKYIEIRGKKRKFVPFRKEYQRAFDITLNPLIHFIDSVPELWAISFKGEKFVCSALQNYAKFYRNDHFHKDNIYQFEIVKYIRENTILLVILLLGSINIPNEELNRKLEAYDDTYDRLVEALYSVRGFQVVYMQFGDKVFICHRHWRRKALHYDSTGAFDSKTIFVKLSDPNEVPRHSEQEYEQWYNSQERIILSKDNIPDKIWWINVHSEKRVIWDNNGSASNYLK